MQEKKIKHFSLLTGIACNVFAMKWKRFEGFENTFYSRCPKGCDYTNPHFYGDYEAVR